MTLRLTIENVASLTSGDPVTVELDGHGLVIGRAAHVDWTLPDPQAMISSLHAEIDFRDGTYWLTDRSTNGTFVNGGGARLAAPHPLTEGDLITIGHYSIRAELTGGPRGASAGGAGSAAVPPARLASVWNSLESAAAKPIEAERFGAPERQAIFASGDRATPEPYRPPTPIAVAPDPFGLVGAPSAFGGAPIPADNPFGPAGGFASSPPSSDPFGTGGGYTATPPPSTDPFGTGAAYAAPSPALSASPVDPFGLIDGFGATPPAVRAPVPPAWPGAAVPDAPAPASFGASIWGQLVQPAIDFGALSPAATPVPGPAITPPPATAATMLAANSAAFARFLAAAGLRPKDVDEVAPDSVLAAAGELLRQTADGLIRLLDARARVRHQFGIGANVTTFQRAGNNPLKWTRSAEEALRQLVGKPDAGFLTGPQAVRGAFEDLQAHEMAMMAAMQEALKATVERFAPPVIRGRVISKGFLAKVLPQARDAALWQAYETEYKALADESEAAYLDLFAKNFKIAYAKNIARVDTAPGG